MAKPNYRFLLGLFLLVLVTIFWSAASVLVQHIYCDFGFPNAVFVTFVGSALISMYLPLSMLLDRWRATKTQRRKGTRGSRKRACIDGVYCLRSLCKLFTDSSSKKCRGNNTSATMHKIDNTRVGDHYNASDTASEHFFAAGDSEKANKGSCCDNPTLGGASAGTGSRTGTDQAGRRSNDDGRRRGQSSWTRRRREIPSPSLRDVSKSAVGGGNRSDDEGGQNYHPASDDDDAYDSEKGIDTCDAEHDHVNAETLRVALILCPIMLAATLCHDLSLAWTSVTSMMVLSSTSTAFAFAFAVLSKDERFTAYKAVGVVMCMLGSVATAVADGGDDGHMCGGMAANGAALVSDRSVRWSLLGDAAGLVSAAAYGAYTTLVRLKCRDPEDDDDDDHASSAGSSDRVTVSMELLLGYVGLINTIVLAPFIFIAWYFGWMDLSNLSWTVFGYICLAGLLNDVLSEYLWAKSIVLTSATISNVGLSLTVPAAFFADWILQKGHPATLCSAVGATGILLGFILVTLPNGFGKDGISKRSKSVGEKLGIEQHETDREGRIELQSTQDTFHQLDHEILARIIKCGNTVSTQNMKKQLQLSPVVFSRIVTP